MPHAAFILSEVQEPWLGQLAETLSHELGLQGVPSSLSRDGFLPPRRDLIHVLIDPHAYVREWGEAALPDDMTLQRTIFVCAAPPRPAAGDEYVALLERAGAVFAIDPEVNMAVNRLGLPGRLLRPGYSLALDRFDPEAPRPIDVMFLGRHSLRRTRYLSHAAGVLARHDCRIRLYDGAGEEAAALHGADWSQLPLAKVVVDLHRDDDAQVGWWRVINAVHSGAVVVSEHSSGLAPFVPGEHLFVASPDALPFVAESLLRDERRLAIVRTQAFERLRDWLPFALPVAILRAAIVELAGEPVPRMGARVPGPPRADTPAARAAPRLPVTEAPHPVPLGSPPHEIRYESAARAPTGVPRVSIVIVRTADQGSAAVIATLESLLTGRLRPFELIVVDSAGDGISPAPLEDWLAGQPTLAARLAVTEPGTAGRGRNVGVSLALAPLCLILDAGQELYPRCLQLLVDSLEQAAESTFAYPIQEVIGSPEDFVRAGGDYLLSYTGWDPVRFGAGNLIHAPFLIRTERLRELGGFAEDPGLAGFEDFDLWRRVAERGWHGQPVAQILARRPESASSSLLRALHPAGLAAATAINRSD